MSIPESTPILLCRPDGTVTHKNAAAIRAIRCIRRGESLCRYLSPEERELLTGCLPGQAVILHLNCIGSFRTACVMGIKHKGEPAAAVLFPALLQPVCRDSVVPWMETVLQKAAARVALQITDFPLDFSRGNSRELAMMDSLREELNQISRPQPAVSHALPMRALMEIFHRSVQEFAHDQGCRLTLQADCQPEQVKRGDFGSGCCALMAIAILLSAMLMCRESTRRVIAEVRMDRSVVLTAVMTYRNATFSAERAEDFYLLSGLFCGNRINVMAALGVLRELGGRVEFSLKEGKRDNLIVRLDVPLGMVADSALHRPAADWAVCQQKRRLMRAMAFLLNQSV